jgi:hypothetical protein
LSIPESISRAKRRIAVLKKTAIPVWKRYCVLIEKRFAGAEGKGGAS